MTLENIITVLVSVAGSLGIRELVPIIFSRRRVKAETDEKEIDAKRKDIDLQQDQYDYLIRQLDKSMKDYTEMQEQLKKATTTYTEEIVALQIEFTKKINDKCMEIAELKSKVVFYRGFRCYKTDCDMRDQVYKKKEEVENDRPMTRNDKL